jgi:hypothetical protein
MSKPLSKADEMMTRICGEYREMPGLMLNREQARRLWQVDDAVCGQLLDILVEARFLRRRADGQYVRTSST